MYYENSEIIRLDSFSKQIQNSLVIVRLISVLEMTALLKSANLQYFSLALFARSYRVGH